MTTASIVCKAFLQKCPQEKRERFLRFLPQQKQAELQELPSSFYKDPTRGIAPEEEYLKKLHFSWFTPLFRTFSESEVRIFLSALMTEQIEGLKKLLLFSNHGAALTPFSRPFVQKTLWHMIQEKSLLPIECLPDSPLNQLLELHHNELVSLIDLLGIHDLSLVVKQIIDKTKLQHIHAALTSSEYAFLNTLLLKKEVLSFKPFSLEKWDGKPASLRALIQKRGMNRLAKALYSSENSLLWHVSHILDMPRGELLSSLATPLDGPRAKEILIGQVVELFPLLKGHK